MNRLIIVRHGQTDANVQGKTQGQIDTDLNKNGLEQAKKTGNYIRKNYSIDETWASDLKRTQQTAKEISQVSVKTNLLREMSFGKWENRLFKEIMDEFPDLVKDYANASDNFKAPDGESFIDMHERAKNFMKNISWEKETTLIVSHGGFMRVLLTTILNLPRKNLLNFQFENCSITEVIKIENKQPILNKINFTEHLL
mgnify:FL=1|tara:strand:- start:1507 stop:2100 length:594 start_codon:yes stop_codon:yes gene_type:complete